jgi:hypothetical protein
MNNDVTQAWFWQENFGKWTDKIQDVSQEQIQVPDYQYGNNQNTLDYKIALRNKPTNWWLFASMSASSNMTIPNSTATTITNLLTKSWNTTMTATDNEITITQEGNYLLSAYCFAWWSSTIIFRIMKNWTSLVPHYRSWTSSAWSITPFINIIEPLVVWDVLTLLLFQNTWANQTLQSSRLSVLKI